MNVQIFLYIAYIVSTLILEVDSKDNIGLKEDGELTDDTKFLFRYTLGYLILASILPILQI